MQLSNAPGKLLLPFANAGAKNTIPTASQIGITAGAASLTDGFPPLTRTPIAAGGVPPSGLDMNGILYALSAALRWANAGGGYVYDGTFAADSNVGGYPKGARVLRSDGAGYWLNTIDGNTVDPESVTVNAAQVAGWVPDLTNGIAAITMTSANVTLTPAQYGKPIVVLSGVLTANLNLIFPNLAGEWTVINNTTGPYSITCKTAAGTGVVVTGSTIVVGDGTNIQSAVTVTPAGLVGAVRNLRMYVSAASATATLTADEIVIVSALGGATYKIGGFNKTVNLATTGAGGMDTGTAPVSGYVALYAIYNPASGASALLAANATASAAPNVYGGANMPAGYTASALVSVWPTNASGQFKIGYQNDRSIIFSQGAALSTGTSVGSYTSLSISGLVPANAKTIRGTLQASNSLSTSQQTNLSLAGDAAGTGMALCIFAGGTDGGGAVAAPFAGVPIITNQTVYYQATASAGTPGYTIFISGYTF